MATKLFHTPGSTGEEGKARGGKGLCPVLPATQSAPPTPRRPEEEAFLPTAPWPLSGCDEGFGQEAEDRKQQKQEGGQEKADETPASSYSALSTFRTAKQCFQKYLHASKLMRHSISSDNGRMWGWVLQGRRSTQSAPGAVQGDQAWGKASLTQLKEEILARQPWGQQCMPLFPLEKESMLHSQSCTKCLQPAFPPPSSMKISSTGP